MNTRRCLKIADRIDALLQTELGRGIDLQRMLAEPLYARDVLLVCDAHVGQDLADLARQYRSAAAEAPEVEEAAPSGWGGAASGFVSSLFDAFRPAGPTSGMPAATLDAVAQAEQQRRADAWYSPARWRR